MQGQPGCWGLVTANGKPAALTAGWGEEVGCSLNIRNHSVFCSNQSSLVCTEPEYRLGDHIIYCPNRGTFESKGRCDKILRVEGVCIDY